MATVQYELGSGVTPVPWWVMAGPPPELAVSGWHSNFADHLVSGGTCVVQVPLAGLRTEWTDQVKVSEFVVAMAAGVIFPAITVCGGGRVSDGSHRVVAAISLGLSTLPGVLVSGAGTEDWRWLVVAVLDPTMSIACPSCSAGVGEHCVSRHAISIHNARRAALGNLTAQADAILKSGSVGGIPPARSGSGQRKKSKRRRSSPRTGRVMGSPDVSPVDNGTSLDLAGRADWS